MKVENSYVGWVNGSALELFNEKVEKINRRAVKHGLDNRISYAVLESRLVQKDEFGFEMVEVHCISVSLDVVQLSGGWSLIGVIDFVSAAPNVLVNSVPGEVLPAGLRSTTECSHCNVSRNRNKLIVVRSEDGEIATVGTTCVQDYLGMSPDEILRWAENVDWIRENLSDDVDEIDLGRGGYGESHYRTLNVIECAIWSVALHGFNKTSEEFSTRDHVLQILNGDKYAVKEFEDSGLGFDSEKAETIFDWIMANDSTSEYIENLKAILSSDRGVIYKTMGMAVSVVAAYHREMEKQRESENTAKRVNAFIGKPGEKVESIPGVLIRKHYFEGMYGLQLIATFDTVQGTVKFFTSSSTKVARLLRELEEGSEVLISGTVKDHEIYKEYKSTLLTRSKLELV